MIVPRLNRRSNLCSTASNGCSTRSTSDPWRPGTRGGPEERDPDPRSRACRGQHRGRCDPPRHRASTWKRPTCGCAPHDTGPSRCPSTPMSSSTATASSCSTPARTGRRSPTRATSPAAPPESSTTASPRASTSAPAIRSPPGWRPSATTSPMCELRCCPISTRTTSAGCRSSNAARGTDLALGASATPPRRGFRSPPAEQPAPPRASGRLHRGRALARTRRPRGGGGPSAWSVPPTTGAGAATGAPLAGGVSRCRCSSRMCQSRSLPVLNSRPPVTHFTGIGGSSRSTGRHAGCTPPRRRRPHSQQDRSARRL